MVVFKLDEAGMTRQEYTVEKALIYLHSLNNWENLVACLIGNQKAIFERLKFD